MPAVGRQICYWKPGREYTTAIAGRSWWKPDGDRAVIAVACGYDEVGDLVLWRVWIPLPPDEYIAPLDADTWGNGAVYMLHDKPHRIAWWGVVSCLSPGGIVLERLQASSIPGVRPTNLGLIWYDTPRDRRAWRQRQQAQLRAEVRTRSVRWREYRGGRRKDERDPAWRGYNRHWYGRGRQEPVLERTR